MDRLRATILLGAFVALSSAGTARAFTLVPLEFTSAELTTVNAIPRPGEAPATRAQQVFNNVWASPYTTQGAAEVVERTEQEVPSKFGLGLGDFIDLSPIDLSGPGDGRVGGAGSGKGSAVAIEGGSLP